MRRLMMMGMIGALGWLGAAQVLGQRNATEDCWCVLPSRTSESVVRLSFAECRRNNGNCVAFMPGPGSALHPSAPRAVIDDPDGYVNVRAGRGTQFEIVAEVREGEVFRVAPKTDEEWWHVLTPDDRATGFMHSSRIRILRDH